MSAMHVIMLPQPNLVIRPNLVTKSEIQATMSPPITVISGLNSSWQTLFTLISFNMPASYMWSKLDSNQPSLEHLRAPHWYNHQFWHIRKHLEFHSFLTRYVGTCSIHCAAPCFGCALFSSIVIPQHYTCLLHTPYVVQTTIETPYHCSLCKANFEFTPESQHISNNNVVQNALYWFQRVEWRIVGSILCYGYVITTPLAMLLSLLPSL